jgi:hypothetical protein
MKRTKLLLGVAALIVGISTALATNLPSKQDPTRHDWIDWDGEIVLYNATVSQAQNVCVSNTGICLRATDNIMVYTTGFLPWERRTGKKKIKTR